MNRSLRTVTLALLAVTAACGKKGPPLAPFVRVPATVANVTAQRVGGDIYLSFPVPSTNVDGKQPADIASLEVYAVTSTRPPATEAQRDVATLIATVPVRPLLPELPVPAIGSPPLPLPPGVDRGSPAVVREAITAESLIAVELPVEKPAGVPVIEEEPTGTFGPLVAPPPVPLPRRHYFVVGVSPRGRKSEPSPPLSVALETGSSAPGAPKIEYTESQMAVTWAPPADARSATFLVPPPMKPVSALPKNATPAAPPLAPLPAKSLGFSSVATTYHLYASGESGESGASGGSGASVPVPLTPAPLAVNEHVIPSVNFGVEQCFEARSVDQVAGALVISAASPRTCLTPKDTFAPVAPRSLAAIAGSGVINVIWDANTERDLAGYLVLRAEAPGDTLQPITQEPVTAATYRDESARPGTRYVYAVVAVDRAGNRSELSNRVEETAR